MEWTRQKVDSNSLNNGQEYTTDSQVSIESLNAMVNSGLYSQDVVDNLKVQPYSATSTYKYPNIVSYNGSSYMAIYAVDGVYTEFQNVLPTTTSHWAILAQKGTDGKDGEKGDSGINSALLSNTYGNSDTNGYTQKAINGLVSKPNILINSNFAINQRGETEYNNENAPNNHYTVDRVVHYGAGEYTLTPKTGGGIIVANKSTNIDADFAQIIENGAFLYGNIIQTVSMSISIDGGESKIISASGISKIGTTFISIIESGNGSTAFGLFVQWQANNTYKVWFRVKAGHTVDIDWWQLEPSAVFTSYTPPNPADEMLKCLRFYQRFAPKASQWIPIGQFLAGSATAGYAQINLKVPMRSHPILTYSNLEDIKIGYNNSSVAGNSVTAISFATEDILNSIYKAYVTTSNLIAGNSYYIAVINDGYIAFDAEL